ncbi:MAG: hypothetical protein U0930_02580 [Pirellulales bacterium]
MLIQKRWPILFTVGSIFAYIANNYTIGGIENLRLQPRQSVNGQPMGTQPGLDLSGFGSGGFGSGSFGSLTGSSLPSTSSTWHNQDPTRDLLSSAVGAAQKEAGPWVEKLGVGEKLAVIQDQLSTKIADVARSGSSGSLSLPSTSSLASPSMSPMSFGTTASNTTPPKPIAAGNGTSLLRPQMDSVPSFRLASFNVNSLGVTQLAKPTVAEALVGILRQFDLVALQGIQSDRDDILPVLVERLNQTGRRFDYLIGPRVGYAGQTQQFAFIFDTTRIETDRYQLYTIDDPENLMTYDPLVGWFRCKESASNDAFTFSLVNIRINRQSASESSFVPNLFHAVSSDGHATDDLVLVETLVATQDRIAKLNSDTVKFAIRNIPTDVAGQNMFDCILFPTQGTTEFTGRSGVFDFLRKYNMSLEQATEISPQMPVWAEFYVVEGAHPGRVAPASSSQLFQ